MMIGTIFTLVKEFCQWAWMAWLRLYRGLWVISLRTLELFLSKDSCLLKNFTLGTRIDFWEGIVAQVQWYRSEKVTGCDV